MSCILSGQQYWLFIDAADPRTDKLLDAQTSDNWNGFRSSRFPSMLSVAEMRTLAQEATDMGIRAELLRPKGGDILRFNGQWWHATSYDQPVLSLFCATGKDMESAHRESQRRHKMKRQKGLKMATFSMGDSKSDDGLEVE